MRRRRVLFVVVVLAVFSLLAAAVAGAASDLYGNVGPGQSFSGIAGRYPLSRYSLDQHFDAVSASLTGGVDASGIPPMIAYFLASVIWQLTAFLANAVIALFTFAFSLDLLHGSSATGGTGALAPVTDAIHGLYANTFGDPWLVIAVTVAGCWAMWKALVQRRYTETAGALAMSLAYCVIALAIVSQPAQTIGLVSRWTNEMSTAFLSITTRGEVTSSGAAKEQVSDNLYRLLILEPWTALEFGGTQHCVKTGTGSTDHDPESVSVRPLPGPARSRLDGGQTVTVAGKTCINNTARYAEHFLRYPDGKERNGEYDAINSADPGKLPDAEKGSGYRPGIADKPAVDAMEKGGQYQRLLLALVICTGELGVLLLLGALSISVVLAQVLVLLLACFAPVALVLGVIPGRGHDWFKGWLARLGSLLIRKAVYSLVLAVLLAVMAALQDASAGLGWLMAFGLQAALCWTVFIQRKQLASGLTSVVTGPREQGEDSALRKVMGLYAGSRILGRATRRLRHHDPEAAPQPRPQREPTDTPSDEAIDHAQARLPRSAAGRTPEPREEPDELPDIAAPVRRGPASAERVQQRADEHPPDRVPSTPSHDGPPPAPPMPTHPDPNHVRTNDRRASEVDADVSTRPDHRGALTGPSAPRSIPDSTGEGAEPPSGHDARDEGSLLDALRHDGERGTMRSEAADETPSTSAPVPEPGGLRDTASERERPA